MPPVKRTVREVLPEITWDKIAPPYPDYPYFQGIGAYSFQPAPTPSIWSMPGGFIEASTLAYAEEDFAREKFQFADFKEIKFLSIKLIISGQMGKKQTVDVRQQTWL